LAEVIGIDLESVEYGERAIAEALVEASSTPVISRVLKDIFHLMEQIDISLKHGLSKEFKRRLRDAIFVPDKDDRERLEAHLAAKNITWEEAVDRFPDWLWQRVKRAVPPPDQLYPVVKELFDTYGPLKCARTGHSLFSRQNWEQAANVLVCIKDGYVSDPPGIRLYKSMGVDKDGLPVYSCARGTNSVEGGVHRNVIMRFASLNASPQLLDAAMAEYILRHNMDVSYPCVLFICLAAFLYHLRTRK
jgi:hypothetical protein